MGIIKISFKRQRRDGQIQNTNFKLFKHINILIFEPFVLVSGKVLHQINSSGN